MLAVREADFGKEIIPIAIGKYNVFGYVFNGYWCDIGTIASFFEANLELTDPNPPFNFFVPNGVIFTRARFLPPVRVHGGAQLKNTLLGEGCIIHGSEIEHYIVCVRAVHMR